MRPLALTSRFVIGLDTCFAMHDGIPSVARAAWRLYVLAVSTRMRELLGLKWANVDPEAGTLRVRRTLTRHGGKVALGELKTKKSRRTVRLTPRAVEVLG